MAKKTSNNNAGSASRSTGGRGSRIRRRTSASRRYVGPWTPSMGTPF